MAFDDRAIKVSPIPKRTVAFEVNKEEAKEVADSLARVMDVQGVQGTPGSTHLRRIFAAFKAVADEREFGGH